MPGRDITLDSPIGLKERPSSHKGKERAPRDAPFMISHKRLQEALNVDARDNTQSPTGSDSTSNISDDKGSKKKESSLVRMVKEMDGVEDYTRCNPLAQQQY
ncbi:hypothetical protein M7I_7814 [Glarea lozoyensis 74030]|uniref:Uncharacterized protein n=1 Tax=Glarea lozoyensis (strain ATCC 74030 / MF5533) TaxID=1104152 RepID=H0EYB5_GLAL7|nr:hypothetical protein M7I_7814 [Glarea lozoyensis 74030]